MRVAAKHGHTQAVLLLLDARPQIDSSEDNPPTPADLDVLLRVAADEPHEALIRPLLERGACPTNATREGYPPIEQSALWCAVAKRHISVVENILSWSSKESMTTGISLDGLKGSQFERPLRQRLSHHV
ncbi:hypothetical protein BJX64DRAFT_193121 [Aspergillus heterothallicus]